MGFLSKIIKKAGRVVTSKSKTTRGVLKVGAVVAAPLIIGGTAAAIFGARSVAGTDNSEQYTPEETGWGGGYSVEQVRASQEDAYRQGMFLGAARQAAAVGAAGGSATTCAAPDIVLQAADALCKLCGG